LLHNHPHLSSGAGTIGQKWPQYKGLSPTPLAIKKINIPSIKLGPKFSSVLHIWSQSWKQLELRHKHQYETRDYFILR
jgi:hypothetical protein